MPSNSAQTAQGPQTRTRYPYQRIWRRQDEAPRRDQFTASAELTGWSEDRDLDILIAPLDATVGGADTEYQTLVQRFNIPDDFVWERETSVTHSFGRESDEDSREVLWVHFLSLVPRIDSPDRQPVWIKWGFILTWLPKTVQDPGGLTRITNAVGLLLFKPPVETRQRVIDFVRSSPGWRTATSDPYVLADIALVSWYHCIDTVAWEVTDQIRTEEEEIFKRARMLRSTTESAVTDLHRIHTSAKNAIFMIEACDAAIRLVDSTLSDHELFGQRGDRLWENTRRRLLHRRELFHSTKLRTVSCQARIKNTVDLAFHINTAYDSQVNLENSQVNLENSQVNLENSRSVRLISIVGLVFIPFSAVTSIFGTQFFSPGDRHMNVNPDFWLLWVTAVPLTLLIMAAWRATERGTTTPKWLSASAGLSLAPCHVWWPKARKWMGRSGIMSEATELQNIGAQNV